MRAAIQKSQKMTSQIKAVLIDLSGILHIGDDQTVGAIDALER